MICGLIIRRLEFVTEQMITMSHLITYMPLVIEPTLEMIILYKTALSLFKLYNNDYNPLEFTLLNFNQILTG